jgi:DNA mismatch endonuclease (patch repair protein)
VKREAAEISTIMRRVRSQDTTPERLLQKALRAAGVRFRTCAANLPGKPDIVIPSKRVAVFIDGDFWHGGQWKRRKLASLDDQFRETASRSYWLRKIRRNMDRDCRVSAALLSEGWSVVRLWESATLRDAENCAKRALKAGDRSLRIVPSKTFAEFFPGSDLMRCSLEKHGWTAAYASDGGRARAIPRVTLAAVSLAGAPGGAFLGSIQLLDGMRSRRPPLALFESVRAWLTLRQGRDLEEALLALNRLGYAVDAFLLGEKGLFIVGLRVGEQEPAELRLSDVRTRSLVNFINARPQIRWSIRNLPPAQAACGSDWIAEHYLNPVVNELLHTGPIRP